MCRQLLCKVIQSQRVRGKSFYENFQDHRIESSSGGKWNKIFLFLVNPLFNIIFKVHLMLCKVQAMIMVLGMKFQVQLEGFLGIKVQYHHDNMFIRK